MAVLSPLTQFIFHRLINPGFFETAIRYGVEQGKTTLHFNLPSYMLQSVLAAIIIGSITSLVIAAMIKKEASV